MSADAIVITDPGKISLDLEDIQEIQENRDPLVATASAHIIVDQASLDDAAGIINEQIKPMIKEIKNSCDPVCSAANAAHKAATSQRSKLLAPLEEARGILGEKISSFMTEQRRIAEEERRRVEAERLQREQQARAEAEAERARLAKIEEDNRLEAASQLEEEGKTHEAEQVLNNPDPVPYVEPEFQEPEPIVEAPPVRPKGISIRKTWKGEVVDLKLLVEAVAAGKAPLALLSVDQKKLNAQAQALDGQIVYPGVRVFEDSKAY